MVSQSLVGLKAVPHFRVEWDQKESLAEEEKLEWEDNWDDVDAEDDFTAALRFVLSFPLSSLFHSVVTGTDSFFFFFTERN